jgi:large subunit ribosomal protein L29
MKASEIRELSDDELAHQLAETQQEMFNLRMQKSFGQMENPAQLRIVRRDLARMKTVIREKETASS